MAFYHTHRPQQFSDLLGQDHIRTTLQNALAANTVGHAYLFAGPRGLGKTTAARLLAKAVNCEKINNLKLKTNNSEKNMELSTINYQLSTNPEPCNKCPACIAITKGNALDVLEIDAASNRGIDEIRELRDMVKFPPSQLHKKVIIIDEVHMLTKEAFNALLKTLEEPPEHIIFILATTEPHKIPATILSRVQRFDFALAKDDQLAKHLIAIAKKEKKSIDNDAAVLIASLAEGSFRDGVMLLEQISTSQDKITANTVRTILGLSSNEEVIQFITALEDHNRPLALQTIDDFSAAGGDPSTFITQIIALLRTRLRENDDPRLVDWINGLLLALNQLKSSPLPRLPLELFIAKQLAGEHASSAQQLDTISVKTNPPINNVSPAPPHTVVLNVVEEDKPASSPVKTEKTEAKPAIILSTQVKHVIDENIWHNLIKSLRDKNASLAALLEGSHLINSTNGDITIAVKFKFHQDKISSRTNLPLIETALQEITGRTLTLQCIVDADYVKKRESSEEQNNLVDEATILFEGA